MPSNNNLIHIDHIELKAPKKWVIIVCKEHAKYFDNSKKRYSNIFLGYTMYLGLLKKQTDNRITLKLNSNKIQGFNKKNAERIYFLKRKPSVETLTYLQQHLKHHLNVEKVLISL